MSKTISREFSGTKGERAALISQLEAQGENFDKESIVAITQNSSGDIIWLEKGHLGDHPSGLAILLMLMVLISPSIISQKQRFHNTL